MNDKPSYEELELKIKLLETKLAAMRSLEQSVNVNNSFLKMLFNTIPNPMFYKDIKGVYQHCNDAFTKIILGIPKERIIGKTLYDLPDVIPEEYADIYYEKDQALFDKPGEQFYEGQVKCADGKIRDYHFYKSTFVLDGKVLGLVGVMLDVSDYKKTLRELNSLSVTDYLTNLYNRRHFQEVYDKKLSALSRHNHRFSFALIDIDYFKEYNDNHGHHAGDMALKELSKVLKDHFSRLNDYVFRLGGEEFGVLFDVNSSEDAFKSVEHLRLSIEKLHIDISDTLTSKDMTISIGLGNIISVSQEINGTDIYNEIDQLLYESKKNGRNKVTSKDIVHL